LILLVPVVDSRLFAIVSIIEFVIVCIGLPRVSMQLPSLLQ